MDFSLKSMQFSFRCRRSNSYTVLQEEARFIFSMAHRFFIFYAALIVTPQLLQTNYTYSRTPFYTIRQNMWLTARDNAVLANEVDVVLRQERQARTTFCRATPETRSRAGLSMPLSWWLRRATQGALSEWVVNPCVRRVDIIEKRIENKI